MKKLGLLVMPLLAISLLASCGGKPQTYTITYENLLDSTTDNPTSYTVNDAFFFKNPVDRGYEFTGWHLNSEEGENITEIKKGTTGDLTLYASWGEAIDYDINYHNVEDATHTNPNTYTIETETITLTDASKDGYDFKGWFTDEGLTQSITSIVKGTKGELDIYAKWDAIPYTITYNNLKGLETDNPTNYTIETDTFTLKDPIGDCGYKFTGWHIGSDAGESITQIEKGSTINYELYASWGEAIDYDINYHNVEDATHTNPDTYTIETETITLTDASKDGYDFKGWFTDEGLTQSITSIVKGTKGELDIYAKWDAIPYTISYNNLKGLETDNPTSYTIETDTFTLKDPIGDCGYKFTGWHIGSDAGESITQIEKGSTINYELYASWGEAIDYDISYEDMEGITHTNPTTYTVEDTVTLSDPTDIKVGYDNFGHWEIDGQTVTGWNPGEKNGPVTVTAIWENPTEYSITYNLDGGTNDPNNPTKYTIADNVALKDPTLQDFIFTGWYIDENKTQKLEEKGWKAGEKTGDITLYADWRYKKTLDECSWSEISTISSLGNPSKYFDIGDIKTASTNGNDYQVRIIDFNRDVLSGDTANVGITFEFVNTIYSTSWSDPTVVPSTAEHFDNGLLYKCLQENGEAYNIVDAIVDDSGDLMDFIKTVNKDYRAFWANAWHDHTYDTKLFPLSYSEINGDQDTSYSFYTGSDVVEKRRKNDRYWLRSPTEKNMHNVWSCDYGELYEKFCQESKGVAPAFCI